MDEKKLKALAAEWAKVLKTEADLNQFSRMLAKLTVEAALNAELTILAMRKTRQNPVLIPVMVTHLKRDSVMKGRLSSDREGTFATAD